MFACFSRQHLLHNFWRWPLRILLFAAVCLIAGTPRLRAADDVVLRLQQQWDQQRSAISTGKFRARFVRVAGDALRDDVTRDSLLIVLDNADLSSAPDGLLLLCESLLNEQYLYGEPWAEVEIIIDGSATKTTYVEAYKDEQHAKRIEHLSSPGREIVSYRNIKHRPEVQVRSRPSRPSLEMKDLRILPYHDPERSWNILTEEEGRLKLRMPVEGIGGLVLDVERADGYVHSLQVIGSHGNIIEETFQFGRFMAAGEVVFPRVIVKASYSGSAELVRLQAIALDSATVNGVISSADLAVGAEAETSIYDFRENPSRPTVRVARRPLADVVETLDATPLGLEAVPQGGRWRLILLLVNIGLAIACLVWVLWRHFRKPESGTPSREGK